MGTFGFAGLFFSDKSYQQVPLLLPIELRFYGETILIDLFELAPRTYNINNFVRCALIKFLKDNPKDLNIQLAKFKEDAEGKDELAKELKDIKDKIRNKDFSEFIDKQIEAGILLPANKDAVFSILQDLDNIKKFDESSNSIETFKSFITALPKQVEFKEIATKDKTKEPESEDYVDADEESIEIYKQAKAIARSLNRTYKKHCSFANFKEGAMA